MNIPHVLEQVAAYPLIEISSPGEKGWIGYLAGAAALAALTRSPRTPWKHFGRAVAAVFPTSSWSHPSAWADVKIWLTNAAILVVAAPLFAGISTAAFSAAAGLLRQLGGTSGGGLGFEPLGIVVKTVVDLIMLDLGLFLAHYAQHKVPLLWLFHKAHHSAEVLTPVTVFRMHPVDVALNMSATGVLTGAGAGFCAFLFAGHGDALRIHGLNVFEAAFLLAGYHLRHSHVWVMFPGWIGRHISSPALHLVHHSRAERHWDKNLGQIFTIWDRLAGTLYLPEAQEEISFGISEKGEEPRYRSLAGLYAQPLIELRRMLRQRSPVIPATTNQPMQH